MMTTTRRLATAVLFLGLAGVAAPVSAKTCREAVSAKSTSRIAGDEAKRDQRAKDNAIARWVKAAQSTYGVGYRFWFRSDEQKVECGRTPKTSHCTVTAKPCTVW